MKDFDDIPLLRDGDEPPGSFPERPDGGSDPWTGEWSWRTSHGPATLVWLFGKTHRAYDVLLPDGTRAAFVERTLPLSARHDEWRLPAPNGGYVHATMTVSPDDLRMELRERTGAGAMFGTSDHPDMRDDLAGDAAFVARLRDEAFAVATYVSLENQNFRKGASRRNFSVSFRTAAAFVAAVRAIGEDYVDFYCSSLEGLGIGDEVAQGLRREFAGFAATAGWRAVSDEEAEASRDEIRELVATWSERGATACPDWVLARGIQEVGATPAGAHDVFSAMRMLAWRGQVSEEEYDQILGMV